MLQYIAKLFDKFHIYTPILSPKYTHLHVQWEKGVFAYIPSKVCELRDNNLVPF